MANATQLPLYANNKFFFWNAKLTDSLDDSTTDQTIYWDTVPVDENSATITGSFLIAVRNTRRNPNRTEMMWVPASAVAADGLSATGVIRGLKPSGLDFTTGSSSFVYEFDSGDEIFCAILPQDGELLRSAVQGLIQTGAVDFIMGAGAAATVTQKRATGSGTSVGWLRWDTSTGKVQFSNDGTTWTNIDSVSSSNLVTVSSADTTPGYLNDKIDTATSGRLTKSITGPAGNEKVALTLTTTLTDAEMNGIHTGISSNVTGTNLAVVTGGVASNADALHTHSTLGVQSYTAYEAITADNAVALLPVETPFFTQLTDTLVNLGDTNGHRRYAVRYVPTQSGTLTDWNFRAREAVNGATALGNMIVSLQTESASAPSGTPLTNATATISQVTQRTWGVTTGTRTATFAGTVSFTAGVPIWFVIECSATDATNYIKLGCNDTYVGNYLNFQRLTYDLDAGTWGNSSTTSILFGWSNTTVTPFGYAVCPTDADFAWRTWNFKGFATSSVAAFASVSVETDIANLSGLVANGLPYYISSTAGAITQTKPSTLNDGTTASYAIGTAFSSTLFKINLATKKYVGRLTPTASATTAHQIIAWFKPKLMSITGGYLSTANIADLTTLGIFDGTINYNVGARITNGGAPIVGQAGTEQVNFSFGPQSVGAYWQGAGASVTNVGLTYTVTKTSTPADYSLLYTLEG